MSKVKKIKHDSTTSVLDDSMYTILMSSQKLQAFGSLLNRPAITDDEYDDLRGLGIALKEIGDDLRDVWRKLDAAPITGSKNSS